MRSIIMKLNVILLSAIICFCLSGCIKEESDTSIKTDDEIITENAGKFLNSRGISTEDKTLFFDKENKEWAKIAAFSQKERTISRIISVLKDKEFQAVRFAPKGTLVIGDVYWVFVDKQSKKVITFLGFK